LTTVALTSDRLISIKRGRFGYISHPLCEASNVGLYTRHSSLGAEPRTHFIERRWRNKIEENRHEKETLCLSHSESTYQTLKRKANRGRVTMTEFLERAITDKEIVLVDGIQELISEMKAIGRNLNQLTTLANMGKVDAVYLADTKAQLSDIYEKLSALCEVNREWHRLTSSPVKSKMRSPCEMKLNIFCRISRCASTGEFNCDHSPSTTKPYRGCG
jgi:hypothetical protein